MADATQHGSSDRGSRTGQRVSAYVPAELYETFKNAHPDLNVSALLQEAMRDRLGCHHDDLGCLRCGHPEPRRQIEELALGKFFADAMWRIGELGRKGGTAEGAQRVLKDLGERSGVPGARTYVLTRPSRAQRKGNKVKELPAPKPPAAAAKKAPTAVPVLSVVVGDQAVEETA